MIFETLLATFEALLAKITRARLVRARSNFFAKIAKIRLFWPLHTHFFAPICNFGCIGKKFLKNFFARVKKCKKFFKKFLLFFVKNSSSDPRAALKRLDARGSANSPNRKGLEGLLEERAQSLRGLFRSELCSLFEKRGSLLLFYIK